MLIDKGGAEIRRQMPGESWPGPWPEHERAPESTWRAGSVTFSVTETHDGEPCDCIDEEMTLTVGDELELIHICNDGRIDKVLAKVVQTTGPVKQEHGRAEVRRPT